jgi:hypothetical protein
MKSEYTGDQFVTFLKDHCEALIRREVALLDEEVYGVRASS